MTYYTGSIAAVPTARKDDYIAHATAAWNVFKALGATSMVETWGVDVPRGKHTDFQGAVAAKDDESIAFGFIEWPDKATADAAWTQIMTQPEKHPMPEMPLDGSRMIFGGFAPVFSQGVTAANGYYQGFTLAVPQGNQSAYVEMARDGWNMFTQYGALGMVEAWAEDVPHGKQTDFYRAVKAEDGEVPVFSWCVWPDRDTCKAAQTKMEAEMADFDFSTMPFDGKRMIWGGFEPVFVATA
jgi:uncharacterized protein YbaA (DUF1428 family)